MAEHHKTCAHCGVEFVAKRIDQKWCSKSCGRQAFYHANRDKERDYHRRFIAENPERKAAYDKNHRNKNRDKLISYARDYYVKNKDRLAEYAKHYAELHTERRREVNRAWRAINADRRRDMDREAYNSRIASGSVLHILNIITTQGDNHGND